MLIFLSLFSPVAGFAETPEALFKTGKFKAAAEAFESSWKASNHESAALAYNAGTAWAQAENYNRAYGYLLKAEQFEPRDPDIQNNLHFVEEKLSPEARNVSPIFPFGASVLRLSPLDGLGWLFGGLLCLGFSLVLFVLKKMRGLAIALCGLAMLFFIP